MRPTTKNTNNCSRTDNKKYQEQNHKKEKTNNNHSLLFFYRIRVHYTVLTQHTTPHTTPTNQQPGILPTRGDSLEQHSCCSRYPTACHTTKQTIKNQTQTHLLLCKTLYNQQGLKDRKKFLFHQLPKPHTRSMCGTCLHLKTKNLPPPSTKQHHAMTKTCHHQVLTSTHTVTKQILYSP